MKVFDLSNPDFYFLIVLSILNTIALGVLSHKFLQIVQISDYRLVPYGKWLKDTKAKWFGRIVLLGFLSFCCVFTTNVLFDSFLNKKLFGYLGLIFYFSFITIFAGENHKIPQKKPLKITKRMSRLYAMLCFLYLVISFITLALALSYSKYLRASVLTLTPVFVPLIVPLAVVLIYPFEKLTYEYYKKRCKKTLEARHNLIKIAITGSFGKTSTKNFLANFLGLKYKVCATPASFNTPMGICKVVSSDLKEDDEIFIVEMGAKRIGDINELCDMVEPDAGIITAVGEQHLETFKNLDNVILTKSELYENLPEDAFCVFNVASQNTKQMFLNCNLKNKIAVGYEDSYLTAKDIIATCDGLQFKICYNGKEYKTKTKILGEHNVQNILLAVAMALAYGVDFKKIVGAIPTLEPVEHRLELKKLENDILIIDDSFNSNIQGTAVALETLGLFENNRKIVVTPGLVELGKLETAENIEFGKRIAEVADIVILVGKNQTENIKTGLLKNDFDEKNIMMFDSLFEVTNAFKTLLKQGDVVLLENDLPDNYK